MHAAPQMLPREGWAIRFHCATRDVPPQVLDELLVQLRGIVDELASIEEGRAVWRLLGGGELRLAVDGWRFGYRIPRRGLLTIDGAHPIPRR